MNVTTVMPAEDKRAVGKRIRHARMAAGYKRREDFAVRVGVHPGSVARWETGGSLPTPYYLEKIAEATGASVSWLRYGTGPGPESKPSEQRKREHQHETEEGFESLLYSKAALYQTLSDFGPPGHRTDDKLSLIDLLSKVAADLKREGKRLPTEILSQAHADILNGKI